MEADLKTIGDTYVITLQGRMDVESMGSFCENCMRRFKEKKIIFNMQKVNFVGSQGIVTFLRSLQTLSEIRKNQLSLVVDQPEFKKVFVASKILDTINLFGSENEALNSSFLPSENLDSPVETVVSVNTLELDIK